MLPFTTLTKVGPGDKTKAYVVRQNVCLKILLFSLIGVCVLLMVLASTMYDVHIERRMKARETGVHRREEHHLRLQVGRLGMRLQQQMRDEVRDMSILREYRARMYRAVGEYQNAVRSTVDEATAQNATLRTQLTKLELELDEQLEMAMRQLWSDVNAEGKRAGEKLHNLTAEIIQDLKLDQRERDQFEAQYGEGSDYHEDAEEGYREGYDFGDDDDDDEPASHREHGGEGEADGEDYEESRMRYALDKLLARLQAMPNITLTEAELADWDSSYTAALDSMGDESKEADLALMQDKLVAKLKDKGVQVASGATSSDDEYLPSIFDQFETALEAAKVTPHKPALLTQFAEWQHGSLPTAELVQHVEELYDQNVLESGLFDDWDE